MSKTLTLYTAKVCPYAARTELAMQLAGLPHETFEVDLANKPGWYNERINPASKVPVLVEGEESKEGLHGEGTWKLPESLVVVEYIEDLTGAIFLSKHPKFRATSRYIVERYGQLVQPYYVQAVIRGKAEGVGKMKSGLREFNSLLLQLEQTITSTEGEGEGKFILGARNFGYADLNIAPFVARILSSSRNGLIKGYEGESGIHEELEKAEGLERVREWWSAVEREKAWRKVWDEDKYLTPLRRMVEKREAEKQSKV